MDRLSARLNGRFGLVEGKRVTVAGAARSGIAAAELLVARGARVTLSDARAEVAEARAAQRALGVELELGGHRTRDVHRAPI